MRNWAGNQLYRATAVPSPASIEEVQEVVAGARRLRPLGSRHAFSRVADTDGILVALDRLPRRFDVDASAQTVTVDGGARYGDVVADLDRAGFALHNLPSLPHVSIAGAVATGTHGSGDALGNLATAVVGLELVRADGEVERIGAPWQPAAARQPTDARLSGAVVSLGALGVVTAVSLATEPSYEMGQTVLEDVPLAGVLDAFDEVTAAARIVSLFTDWTAPRFHQVWLKHRVDEPRHDLPAVLAEASPAREDRHPIRGMPAEACTTQRGVPGPWHERLPHFRLDHVPSAGAELQSEFFVDRRDAPAAIAAVAQLAPRLAPLVWVTEIRSIARDELWLSPASGRASVAIHFTWKPDWPAVRDLLGDVERRLAPFDPRPHWGKLFTLPAPEVRARYPERERFVGLAEVLDPGGKLRNDFLDAYVFGG